MTDQTNTARVPAFDLPDRMRKALRESGVTVAQMASELEVTRETVSTWINGRHRPTTATVRAWAQITHVDYQWLRWGDSPADEIAATYGLTATTHRRRRGGPLTMRTPATV